MDVIKGVLDVVGGVDKALRAPMYQKMEEREQRMEINDLNSKLSAIAAAGGNKTEAGRIMMTEMLKDPQIAALANGNSFSPDQFTVPGKTGEAAMPEDEKRLDRLAKIFDLVDKNTDPTGKPLNENVSKYLDSMIETTTGVKGQDALAGPDRMSLADMIGGYPQDTDRPGRSIFSFGDQTVSPEKVKEGTENYIGYLIDSGVPEDQARKQAKKEYAEIMADDKGLRQKYPKMDIGKLFEQADTRKAAVSDGKVVEDTGDGISTTPRTYGDIGLAPADQQDFKMIESMANKAAPGFDIRSDYQRHPEHYQKLFRAIREGVPDPKNPGQKRKLTTEEILSVVIPG